MVSRRLGTGKFKQLTAVGTALIISFAALETSATAASDKERALRYGERLAQECFSCHRRDGKDLGIPGIVAMSEADIVNALMLYKTGMRTNKVMVSVASSLDQAQMQAVAQYLGVRGNK